MEANAPDKNCPPKDHPAPETNPEHAAQALRVKRILLTAMAIMVVLPLLLFMLFHT
jgi:hypothetical protein